MGFELLILLGMGLGTALIIGLGDDAEDTSLDETVLVDEQEVILTGDGDDTIVSVGTLGASLQINSGAGDDVASIISGGFRTEIDAGTGDDSVSVFGSGADISGGDGNDTIEVERLSDFDHSSFVLDGGAGDDSITGPGFSIYIHGGAGNDTIEVTDAYLDEVYGEDGDDRLVVTYGYTGADSSTIMDAGAGNDTLDVSFATVDAAMTELGGLTVSGGEGADTFIVHHQIDVGILSEGVALELTAPLDISDFDPSEDTLIIEPDAASTVGLNYVSATVEHVGSTSIVVLQYSNPNSGHDVEQRISLRDAPDLSIDDIQILVPSQLA